MLKQILLPGGAAALIGACALSAARAEQVSSRQPVPAQTVDAFVQQYDADHDGKLSLEAVIKAATAHFATLDVDHDGTVDPKEIVPAGVSDAEFGAIDRSNDKLLQREEYMSLVKQKFGTANGNLDNSLSKEELNSQAGQVLMRLLR